MTALRCPVCRGEEGSIRFITSEIKVHYPTSEGAFPLIIPGTAGWIGGTDEPTARIDIAGDCGHNWSVLIRQSDLRVRYRVYQDEQNPEGPFMPRRQYVHVNAESPGKHADQGQEACPIDAAPSIDGPIAVDQREEVVPDNQTDQSTDKTEAPVNDAGAAPPDPAKRAGRSEASKEAARERMQALWAQAKAEGRERPGGQIRRQPPAASDYGAEEEEKL